MSMESHHIGQEAGPKGLDFKAMLRAVLPPFILWAAVVLLVSFGARQPGVVCVTPFAWVLACWVGMSCVAGSRSGRKATLLTEAALAGGLFGLLQGLLFAAVVPFMGVRPEEQQKSLVMSLVVIVVGAIVAALLSMAVGAAQAKRRTAQ